MMNSEYLPNAVDWHRLSNQTSLTLDELFSIVFGYTYSFLLNLPPGTPPHIVDISKIAPDLIEWIRSDCAEGKLNCAGIDQENPSFNLKETCQWLGRNNIPWWLVSEKRVIISIEGCEFIEKIAYGYVAEPLRIGRDGFVDWRYYGSLSCWPVRMATQILQESNIGQEGKIKEALRLSVWGQDEYLTISIFPPKEEEPGLYVNSCLFCNWADTKGFSIPRDICEVQLGGNENKLKEEILKMGELLKTYHARITQPQDQQQEEQSAEASAKAKKKAGKKASPLKPLVIEEALKIRKTGETSAPKIARMSGITKILAPNATHTSIKDLSDGDYNKRFKNPPRTVEDWIREGFKDNPL